MSHFTVLVVGPDLETQLAPFQENNMGDCPREYMTFSDNEDEYREEYETEGTEMVVLEDGRLVYSWDDMFRTPDTSGRPEAPAHLLRREVPHKEYFASFEEFVREWHGHEERDEETGRYGYWENPNAKWDWWELGGRWTGFFKLKAGTQGEVGRPGLLTRAAEAGFSDSTMKKNIDLESMREEARQKATQTYDAYEAVIKQHGPVIDFKDFSKDYPNNIDAARADYNNLPVVKALRDADLMSWFKGPVETYGMGREKFVANAVDGVIRTHAVLLNGKWYENGSMGWWGIVTDEKGHDAWNTEMAKLLDSLPEDTLLSVVDCHI